MKELLNGCTEHDGIDCCWSTIYGLGCDEGKLNKEEAKKKSNELRAIISWTFPEQGWIRQIN